jgi:hypothetical protein
VSDLQEIHAKLNRSIPENFIDRQNLLNLIPGTEQRDATVSLVYTLSDQVVFELEKMDKSQLLMKLSAFLNNHPESRYMNLPPYITDSGPNYNEYVNNLFNLIVKFADTNQAPKERYIALQALMADKVFTEYIFRELLPSLIPREAAEDVMSISMSVTSKDIGLAEDRIGNNEYSKVYGAVLLLRSILNDRSLDLRLETVTGDDGSTEINPLSLQGFRPL